MATFTGSDKAISFLFDMVANIAEDYDETSTYSVNDYAIHEGVLYKCTSAIITAETFTPAHWAAVLIMEEVAAGGGGGGSSTLAGLSDVALVSVANGDVLTFDSTLNKWKNAVNSGGGGHEYSTTEQVVGKWIDGKTVYEKTFTGLSIAVPARNTGWINTGLDATGVTAIVHAFCMDASGQYYPAQVVIFGATQTFGFNFQCHTNRDITTIVLQYAK